MKLKEIAKRIAGIFLVFLILTLCWSASFYVTSWMFNYFGSEPSLYIKQIGTSIFGFFIFGSLMFFISRISNVRERQINFYRPIIVAMERMSQGNFNIDLTVFLKQVNSRDNPLFEVGQSVKRMAEELGQMEKVRQEFISNVSHEIQSPLTSISGFANALKNTDLTIDERNHYLTIIETESRRLSKLSDNLLKLTSLESDHLSFDPKVYLLDRQLRRIVLSCEPQWRSKEIEMDIDLLLLNITADEGLMDQVWTNLIHNAIKFTPQGGKISIVLQKDEDNEAVIQIIDTGIGMSKEVQMHIFERFYKGDKSRNRLVEGNGLGLSITKKIIDIHQGDIKVKSNEGTGTTFTIKLPIGGKQ
ncbi:sensor histidine kinase [Bacillus sp. 1NLA3E]|uniref:sensor histidine kinase n=1 Tax=Bacillus sp. 1NLA3E TaxID=666686 RepID=UPI000247F12B|nr:HAMP domain-containing sensor histidine kinase [Bacillus sp. 1NLA3E]AGK55557.1 Two component system histidine kinase [Bacillus sp. 1NLA3E]